MDDLLEMNWTIYTRNDRMTFQRMEEKQISIVKNSILHYAMLQKYK